MGSSTPCSLAIRVVFPDSLSPKTRTFLQDDNFVFPWFLTSSKIEDLRTRQPTTGRLTGRTKQGRTEATEVTVGVALLAATATLTRGYPVTRAEPGPEWVRASWVLAVTCSLVTAGYSLVRSPVSDLRSWDSDL